MTDDRAPFREARLAGKAIHQQQRMDRADLAIIEAAIDQLPIVCRYHGADLTPEWRANRHDRCCCETGRPALARREAEAALERLTP